MAWLMPSFNVPMEMCWEGTVMLLVTGRIQLNSNVVLNVASWDQSLLGLYLSLSQNTILVIMFILYKKKVKLQIHNLYPLLSVTRCFGLLLVAKFRRVCCPSTSIAWAERTGQEMSGQLWSKYTLCSLKLLLCCWNVAYFAEIKIKYSLNNPNAIAPKWMGFMSGHFQVPP